MRIRPLLIAAAAVTALTPLSPALAVAPVVAPVVAPSPAPVLRMTTTGVCPPGSILVPRTGAVREYRHAHRLGVRHHFTRAQHRRLVLCAVLTPSAPASPEPTSPEPAPSNPAAPMPSTSASPSPAPALASWQDDMLARINALRASVGVAPVVPCAPITASAQGYADAMARTGLFAHTGPDGSQPWDRMRAQGYRWSKASENIAKGQPDVATVMAAWIASPGHHENLVDPGVRHVGLGLAVDGGGTHWWVQEFGAGGTC